MAVYGTKGFVYIDASSAQPNPGSLMWIDKEKGVQDVILPEAPIEHICYFVRMITENIPNEAVGKDPMSHCGMYVDTAYDLVLLINRIYENNINSAFHKGGEQRCQEI